MNFLNLGPMEMIIIGVIALVVVGPKKLPELGRMVGRWMKVVREASDEMRRGLYYEDDYNRPTPRLKPAPPASREPAQEDEPAEIVDASTKAASQEVSESSEESDSGESEDQPQSQDAVEKEAAETQEGGPGTAASTEYKDAYPYNEEGLD